MLVIDEVHNILVGTCREQRVVLDMLRFLSNRLQISLVCFGVNGAREAIGGDVQLARRFEQFTLNRWAANEDFETLIASILRNTPLHKPSELRPKSLRRILQITDGITANTFQMLGSLAIEAIESGDVLTAPSKRGCRRLIPRRPSHDGAPARHLATPTFRSTIILDQSPRGLLRGNAFDHAAPWTAGGHIAWGNRPIPDQSPGEPDCRDVRRNPKLVRSLSFADAPKAAHQFIAKSPMQRCARCNRSGAGPLPVLRSELQGWRITCPLCGELHSDKTPRDGAPVLAPYRVAARHVETLLDNHAERGAETWLPPLEIARHLLMRRIPWPRPRDGDLWRYRLLNAIVPDFDAILAKETSFPFTPKYPILPLHIRPALLASVAIIDRAGPAMLKMLQGDMTGDNKNRFAMATDHLISPELEWGPPRQMQLI
ncbi:TniB family NTP-binding protein [Sulfitobacter brevis]|uniref:TniB family NTP-binding protein n=1 Tax=Sulfitobacter brevis TaxID=74348 RepID=UPI001FE59457|nr:TniB family NTP-binding protein [Sulfitobacter brevis]